MPRPSMIDRILQSHPLANHPILLLIHVIGIVWTAFLPWVVHAFVWVWAQTNPASLYPGVMNFWGAFAAVTFIVSPFAYKIFIRLLDRKDRLEALARENIELRKRMGLVEVQGGELRTDITANRTALAGAQGKLEAVTQKLREKNFFPAPPISHHSAVPPTLLIVEDDADSMRLLAEWFTLQGFAVTTAPTVTQAIRLVEKNPHWAILDIKIGVGNGFDVLRHIRANNLRTKVIVAAGVVDDAVRQEADGLKTRWLFEKPIDPDVLLKTMVEHAYD